MNKGPTLRFLFDQLDNLFDEIKWVKSTIREIDRDIHLFQAEDGLRFHLICKRRELLKVFFGTLNLFTVDGEFHPATNTQDLIVRYEYSERYHELMSTCFARRTDR